MTFDPNKAQLTPDQLALAQAGYEIQKAVKAQMADTDEDPGEIDFDDILQIVLQTAPAHVTTILRVIGTADGVEGYAGLLLGAGAGALNHIKADEDAE
ncbi:hypothetical protein LCGC14_1882070 [marine sediment metagenome]|uniref:Uncharacterized protein n=1 Tax=marine sediment metagenome TaxID=412755 RepID=A0A0F9GQ92_9ZZZZ